MSQKAAPANAPAYTRLTRSDIGVLVKLRRDGLTQEQIAQRLGTTQSTVAKWLRQFTDTTLDAKDYLKGQALSMAQKVVRKGSPSVHVQALKGLNVLTEETQQAIVVNIGIKDSDVSLSLSPRTPQQIGEGPQNP